MLLDVSRDVQTSGIQGSRAFTTTENSAKLFSMLSSMLYKDKERSVLTELSSNAVDAHKLVGKEALPIEVTLPTSLCPEVRIRDFGPGLSEDQVYQFLTTYGESSKQGSNDFIGGFGIGSKSPAAVTDTWTIHSHNQGVQKQYLIYVSAVGVPSLTKIMEKPTTESGLEVIVPVKKERINAWIEAAKQTYLMYALQPTIKNATFKLAKVEWKFTTKSFATSPTHQVNTLGTCALINGRLYPLDINKIDSLTPEENALARIGVVFKFAIGDLSLSLSREDLQYDSKTIKALRAKVKDALVELGDMWKNEVDAKASDNYEYYTLGCTELTRWFDDCSYSTGAALSNLYTYLGKGCKHYSATFNYSNKTINFDLKGNFNFRALHAGYDKITAKHRYSSFYAFYEETNFSTRHVKYSLRLNIVNIKDIVFVEDDKASYINLCVKSAYGSGRKNVLIADNFDFLPNFLKSQVIKSSALPKPKIERTARAGGIATSEYYEIVQNHFEKALDTRFKDEKHVAYVEFTQANTVNSITEDFAGYRHILQTAKVSIVGIKPGTKVPAWAKHPKDVLQDVLKANQATYDDACLAIFINTKRGEFIPYGRKVQFTPKPSVWNEFFQAFTQTTKHDIYRARDVHNTVNAINTHLGIKSVVNDKYEALTEKFFATYPMLSLVSRHLLTDKDYQHKIMQYLELVGK